MPTVFAVDIEPAMVAHLTKRAAGEGLANLRAVQASATSPNLPEPVDIVLVVDTFHHIGDRATYFAGVRRRLRPGGRVAIIDFRKDAPGDGPPAHFRFTPEQISAEMAAAGYVARRRPRLPAAAALSRLPRSLNSDALSPADPRGANRWPPR